MQVYYLDMLNYLFRKRKIKTKKEALARLERFASWKGLSFKPNPNMTMQDIKLLMKLFIRMPKKSKQAASGGRSRQEATQSDNRPCFFLRAVIRVILHRRGRPTQYTYATHIAVWFSKQILELNIQKVYDYVNDYLNYNIE